MFPSTTRILLVDDLESIREVVKLFLQRLGFKHIQEADNGAKAYQLFIDSKRSDPFGLVISDWNMPQMTGLELLKNLRSSGNTVPFLIMTTESEKAKVVEAIQAGVNNYMVKPVQEDTLKEKLEAIHKKI